MSDKIMPKADLRGAYLRGADLRGANLRGADLIVKFPPINDHQFISEILWRASFKESQKDFSARIRIDPGNCWEYYIKLAKNKRVLTWARKILFQWDEFKKVYKKWEDN